METRCSVSRSELSGLRLSFSERLLGKDQLGQQDADIPGSAGTRDFPGLVGLEHVPLFEVVEAVEQDAALESFLHLAHVFLRSACSEAILPSCTTTPSRSTRTLALRVIVPLVTMQPAMVPSFDALNTWRTSALTEHLLDLLGLEHAYQGGAHVFGDLVDHAIGAHVDAFGLGQRLRRRVGPHVEADDDRL